MTPDRIRVLVGSFGGPSQGAEFGGPALVTALTGRSYTPGDIATYALVPAQAIALDATPLPPGPTVKTELKAVHAPTTTMNPW